MYSRTSMPVPLQRPGPPAADLLLLHPAIVPPGPVDVVEGGSVIAFTGQ